MFQLVEGQWVPEHSWTHSQMRPYPKRIRRRKDLKKRLDLLVRGFVRDSQGIHHFMFFPSELVQTIFDYYHPFHLKWMNRNITLQIVNGKQGDDQNVYLGGRFTNILNATLREGISITSFDTVLRSDIASYRYHGHFSSIWRMYPLSTRGFTIRPVNVTKTEDVAKLPNCKYLAPRGTDVRDKALSLQLVRPEHGGDDEYYFQNLDDGKYLTVQYGKESIDHHGHRGYPIHNYYDHYRGGPDPVPSLHFADSPSEATLFRLKKYPLKRDRGFDLRIGCRVNYYDEQYDDYFEAHVIGIRYSAFGKEVKLKYGGMVGAFTEQWIDEVTEWITALNPKISAYSKYKICLWKPQQPLNAEEKAEIGDLKICDLNVMEDERYEKRVKSRGKMKSKKRKRGNYRNGKVEDKRAFKRIQRKMRKYGRIQKYSLCY